MKDDDRIWILMSRKLSGEATPEDLAELARFQQQHPEMTYSLQVLSDLWYSQQKETSAGGAKDATEAEEAFQRHLTRMALRDVTQGASGQTAAASAQSAMASAQVSNKLAEIVGGRSWLMVFGRPNERQL